MSAFILYREHIDGFWVFLDKARSDDGSLFCVKAAKGTVGKDNAILGMSRPFSREMIEAPGLYAATGLYSAAFRAAVAEAVDDAKFIEWQRERGPAPLAKVGTWRKWGP